MKKSVIIIMFVLFLSSMCEKNPVTPSGETAFSIHLLKDHSLTINDISNKTINELELDQEAWIAATDIELYDYSSHCMYLKSNKSTYFTKELGISMNDQPFVVQAYYKRCYIGSFHSLALSIAPCHPYIDELSIQSYPVDVLYIAPSWNQNTEDKRNNNFVEYSLRDLNKLHYGISLAIKEIHVVDNSDTATVKYTYELKNKDQDDIYVLDPDKTGNELFHYYTNGINFQSDTRHIYSEYKTVIGPEPSDSWQSNWFAKIKSGQSMERTVTLKGYPQIPNGQYSCTFRFSNPTKIEKDDRYIDDGRIWIGEIQSNTKIIFVR